MSPLDRACEALTARAGYTEYGPVVPPAIVPDLVRAVLLAVREPETIPENDEWFLWGNRGGQWDDVTNGQARAVIAAYLDAIVSTGEPS